jgi:hypothetical protein
LRHQSQNGNSSAKSTNQLCTPATCQVCRCQVDGGVMPVCFESFCHSFQLHAIRSSCTGVCAAPLAPPSHRTGTFSQTLRKRRGDLIFPSSEGHICALHKPYSCVLRYSALSSWQDEQARRPEELVCARSGAIRRVNTLVQGGYICANVVIVACVVASRGSIDASTSGSSLSFALQNKLSSGKPSNQVVCVAFAS